MVVFFRYKFEHLRKSFFKYLINEDESNNTVIEEQESNLASLATFTKIPLLFMTATFSTEMKQTLERIIGIKILTDNTFWGNVKDMTRRNISIEVSSHPQYLNSFKSEVKKAFADGSNKKAIVYLNTAYEAKKFKEKIDMWLDEESPFEGDLVLIYGDMHQEVKAEIITAFTSTLSVDEHMKSKQIYPRILIATSGSVGAGLDSTAINLVYRIGCPGSVFEFIQEMGRCGRLLVQGNPVNSNKYSIHISLEG